MASTSSLVGTKDKYTFVKKNSLPYTTQYSYNIKEKIIALINQEVN